MARFVIDLDRKSLKSFLEENEISKGDLIEFKSSALLSMFSLDRDMFKYDDPDTITKDDIETIDDTACEYYPRVILSYAGDKFFDEVAHYNIKEEVSTIYGLITFIDEEGDEMIDNNLYHFLVVE